MKLSVLIPSTFDRKEMTDNLVKYLKSINNHPDTEIRVKYDNKEMSIGAKRQIMLEEATGEYVVYIDSDDYVPEYYFDEIFKAMEQNPDAIGIEVDCLGTKYRKAVASDKYNEWTTNKDGYNYVRTINHICPVRREIALAVGFENERYAEDYSYSIRLKKSGLIKKEVFINKKMYEYRYKQENSKTKYGLDRK